MPSSKPLQLSEYLIRLAFSKSISGAMSARCDQSTLCTAFVKKMDMSNFNEWCIYLHSSICLLWYFAFIIQTIVYLDIIFVLSLKASQKFCWNIDLMRNIMQDTTDSKYFIDRNFMKRKGALSIFYKQLFTHQVE